MDAARLTIWDDDACRRVHEATLGVLAETGIDVHYAPAVEIFAGPARRWMARACASLPSSSSGPQERAA